jgi:hypothetical protein
VLLAIRPLDDLEKARINLRPLIFNDVVYPRVSTFPARWHFLLRRHDWPLRSAHKKRAGRENKITAALWMMISLIGAGKSWFYSMIIR